MITIHQLKTSLESAEAAYKSADIEHPTAVHMAKEALTHARFEYWNACADLVTRLPAVIIESLSSGDDTLLMDALNEIQGEVA